MTKGSDRTPLTRDFFDRSVLDVAPDLLGRTLVRHSDEGTIEVRLTEVEAYAGEADPGSHAFRGRTARNSVMFGPPGHTYVYFTYGMWHCLNLVCGPRTGVGGDGAHQPWRFWIESDPTVSPYRAHVPRRRRAK
ncbi:DNA-3-methyladenine glycosylase [Streptomyces cyaneofuscatus]|uniref:DNA-3-methyladenine glycosylase n=1 Tax=Streptomyces cyaneofuscatus TaxID=66883 RepID=UPI002FF1B43F